jgi:hypothetical protein
MLYLLVCDDIESCRVTSIVEEQRYEVGLCVCIHQLTVTIYKFTILFVRTAMNWYIRASCVLLFDVVPR